MFQRFSLVRVPPGCSMRPLERTEAYFRVRTFGRFFSRCIAAFLFVVFSATAQTNYDFEIYKTLCGVSNNSLQLQHLSRPADGFAWLQGIYEQQQGASNLLQAVMNLETYNGMTLVDIRDQASSASDVRSNQLQQIIAHDIVRSNQLEELIYNVSQTRSNLDTWAYVQAMQAENVSNQLQVVTNVLLQDPVVTNYAYSNFYEPDYSTGDTAVLVFGNITNSLQTATGIVESLFFTNWFFAPTWPTIAQTPYFYFQIPALQFGVGPTNLVLWPAKLLVVDCSGEAWTTFAQALRTVLSWLILYFEFLMVMYWWSGIRFLDTLED